VRRGRKAAGLAHIIEKAGLPKDRIAPLGLALFLRAAREGISSRSPGIGWFLFVKPKQRHPAMHLASVRGEFAETLVDHDTNASLCHASGQSVWPAT
jgi:hypothetical protein